MSVGVLIAIISIVVVALGTAAFWWHVRANDPERTSRHDFSVRALADRPAGPGAEAMNVVDAGRVSPGADVPHHGAAPEDPAHPATTETAPTVGSRVDEHRVDIEHGPETGTGADTTHRRPGPR